MNMARIVTFGEIMLRLKAPAHERLLQSPVLEATFGGGEANVAVSLANFGCEVSFVSVLPDNALAEQAIRGLRGFGVDTTHIARQGERMGIYFLEAGSNQRSSKVIYDRAHSAIAQAGPEVINWREALRGAGWLHITGITPALSGQAALLSLRAVKAAGEMGLKVSCDLNYRKNLWKYGKDAPEVMGELVQFADVIIANEEDFQKCLGITAGSHDVDSGQLDLDAYRGIAAQAKTCYPRLDTIAITLRQSVSADNNTWQACLYDGEDFLVSRAYALTDIVDRVGGGDSFSAGLLYGLNHYENKRDALEFAVAASCLKHTIPGDYNRVGVAEVKALMKGSGTGRVQR